MRSCSLSLYSSTAVEETAVPSAVAQLTELLRKPGVSLVPKADAAECAREGETCTRNEQCCPASSAPVHPQRPVRPRTERQFRVERAVRAA